MRFLTAAVVAILVIHPAFAQQNTSDPYAQEYRDALVGKHNELKSDTLNSVAYLYFAIGCKVLPNAYEANPLIGDMEQDLLQDGANIQVAEPDIFGAVEKAKRTGLSRSQEMNACNYWRDHPDEVFKVRRLTHAAIGIP